MSDSLDLGRRIREAGRTLAYLLAGLPLGVALAGTLIFSFVGGMIIERAIIRPVEGGEVLTLVIVTLGLFTLVINAFMLLLTSWIAGDERFEVAGFMAAVLGGLIISIVSWAVNMVLDRD